MGIYFLTNAFVALLMSRTAMAITLKFKMHWFLDEASYSGAEKL